MPNNKKGKTVRAAAVSKLLAGAKKRFTNGAQQVPLGGVTMTIADATAKLQTVVDDRTAVVAAQATAKNAIAAEEAATPALDPLISAFEAFVRLTFGSDAGALADFGLEPHKVAAPLTAEQKAVAAVKREATRKARGTTSAKQKQTVKGNVTAALVVTPGPAAPAPAPVGGLAPTIPAAAAPAVVVTSGVVAAPAK